MFLIRGQKKYKSANMGRMKEDYLKKKMSEEMMGTLVE